MPKHQHSDNSQSEILTEQQKRSLLVAGYLQNLAQPSVYNRELTQADYELWEKLLSGYPLKAIDYAFDNWVRNGKTWPKPANILELIGAWGLSNNADDFQPCGQCEEGWVYLTEGRTIGGRTLKVGERMVKRCQCFINWAAEKKGKHGKQVA